MSGPIRDEWIPPLEDLQDWFDEMLAKLKSDPLAFNPVLAAFKNFTLINRDIHQQLNEMLEQALPPKVCVLCTYVLTYSYQWIDSRRTLMKCSSCST